MQLKLLQFAVRVLLTGTTFALLQACTEVPDYPDGMSVSSAYETSGMVSLNPYTRSIINSNNF